MNDVILFDTKQQALTAVSIISAANSEAIFPFTTKQSKIKKLHKAGSHKAKKHGRLFIGESVLELNWLRTTINSSLDADSLTTKETSDGEPNKLFGDEKKNKPSLQCFLFPGKTPCSGIFEGHNGNFRLTCVLLEIIETA